MKNPIVYGKSIQALEWECPFCLHRNATTMPFVNDITCDRCSNTVTALEGRMKQWPAPNSKVFVVNRDGPAVKVLAETTLAKATRRAPDMDDYSGYAMITRDRAGTDVILVWDFSDDEWMETQVG